MATKKKVVKIADLKTPEEIQAFRVEVLRPMEPGPEKRAMRLELNSKAAEVRQAVHAEKAKTK